MKRSTLGAGRPHQTLSDFKPSTGHVTESRRRLNRPHSLAPWFDTNGPLESTESCADTHGGRRRSIAGARTAAPSEIIDLRDLVYIWRESGKEPRRWLDCSGSSGKGKEPAGADAGPEAEGDGAATSAGAGAVGRLNGSGSGTRVAQAVGGRRRIRGERAAVTSRGT